ncbi:MAG: glycoside hydrolase family 99-like domain-containing protein, partial [Acidimicrobiales bacterium]
MVTTGTTADALRTIAFYLPQYHPIPENDQWWGPGYTEWNKVAAARPQFRGHRLPDVPGELGFYDLRLPEVREAQARLASTHGIDAFCYYHYWFQGKRLLQRPLAEVLASGEPRLPFLICWANEPWTRAWDGLSDEVLIEQTSGSSADWERHARALLELVADPRYLRVGGRPMILVYRAGRLSEPLGLT